MNINPYLAGKVQEYCYKMTPEQQKVVIQVIVSYLAALTDQLYEHNLKALSTGGGGTSKARATGWFNGFLLGLESCLQHYGIRPDDAHRVAEYMGNNEERWGTR